MSCRAFVWQVFKSPQHFVISKADAILGSFALYMRKTGILAIVFSNNRGKVFIEKLTFITITNGHCAITIQNWRYFPLNYSVWSSRT